MAFISIEVKNILNVTSVDSDTVTIDYKLAGHRVCKLRNREREVGRVDFYGVQFCTDFHAGHIVHAVEVGVCIQSRTAAERPSSFIISRVCAHHLVLVTIEEPVGSLEIWFWLVIGIIHCFQVFYKPCAFVSPFLYLLVFRNIA